MKAIKRNQEATKLKRLTSVADAILPIKQTEENGVFLLKNGQYSKTFAISDINYVTSDNDECRSLLNNYANVINSIIDNYKITIISNKLENVTNMDNIYLKPQNDDLDEVREELNNYHRELLHNANSYVQKIYITVTCNRKNTKEANLYFGQVESSLQVALSKLGSSCVALSEYERLEIIHRFYNTHDTSEFEYNRKATIRQGGSYKEAVCPDAFSANTTYFEIGDRVGQAMLLQNYPQWLSDNIVNNFMSLNTEVALSISVKPISKEKAIKIAERAHDAAETNATKYQQKLNKNNNWSGELPYQFQVQREATTELLNNLTKDDQRMFYTTVTLVHLADDKAKLDSQSDQLKSLAAGSQVKLNVLCLPSRQISGLVSSLPFGIDEIQFDRTLLSEGIAAHVPFKVQDVLHKNGLICGVNKVSGNLIVIDRRKLINGNAWVLGKPGSGKSFNVKQLIILIKLFHPDADIMVIDPEREYRDIITRIHGEVIDISSASPNHINAMDLNANYSEASDPLIEKSEFIISIFERILNGKIDSKQKSIIDRCIRTVYEPYIESKYTGTPPTLKDLVNEFNKVNDSEISRNTAQELALQAEYYTSGSLNTFAQQTNVNTTNNIICYDIKDLGAHLLPIGMLVVLDSVLNRVSRNREKNKQTFILIDEIYLLFMHEYSAEFLYKLWKRIRKYGGYITGVTQNVEDLLQSEKARTMLANSELITLLSQAQTDKEELARLLNMSEEETSYVTETPPGEGIIHIGTKNIPFVNRYPTNMSIYKLLSTTPGE